MRKSSTRAFEWGVYKMKKLIAVATCLAAGLSSTLVHAQQVGAVSLSDASSRSVNYNNFQSSRSASSAIAPGLFASGLSCSGSATAGGAGSGWGFSLGLTREDSQCNARENAKSVLGLTGDRLAAKEVLCDVPAIRAAFARSRHPCMARVKEVNYARNDDTNRR